MHKFSVHKADFAKNMEVLRCFDGLDSSTFFEILYGNTPPDESSIYQVKIAFKHLCFAGKAYLSCRKRPPARCSTFNFLIFSVYSSL